MDKNKRKDKKDEILQVVGHTPVKELYQDGSIISCDVFSTNSDGVTLIGTQEFLLLDTENWKWEGVKLR